jgi:phytol kinase
MTTPLPDALALVAVGIACLGLMGLAEALRVISRLPAETTRKLVHVGLGLLAAAFPWLFGRRWPVLILCAAFAVLLFVTRRQGRLASVHGIERDSLVAICFPVAVGLVFAFSFGRPAAYAAAILVLALADAAAGLAGRTWGRHVYDLGGGTKSLEGSAVFFVLAAAIVIGAGPGLGLQGQAGAGVAVALAATLLEATAPFGTDNLLVPCGVALLLAWPTADQTTLSAACLGAAVVLAAGLGLGSGPGARRLARRRG